MMSHILAIKKIVNGLKNTHMLSVFNFIIHDIVKKYLYRKRMKESRLKLSIYLYCFNS